jgi:beta-lactam-binding protein with PASTA domain
MDAEDADWVTVPSLIAMMVSEARSAGQHNGVVVTSADPDGPPLGALTWPGTWIVIAQRPVAGTRVARWSTVVVEFEERRGGSGAGDGPGGKRQPFG